LRGPGHDFWADEDPANEANNITAPWNNDASEIRLAVQIVKSGWRWPSIIPGCSA
jgi:hypothetical protein